MRSTNINDLLRDQGLIEIFFYHLVDSGRYGFDAPRSARKFLSILRKRLGFTSFFLHFDTIERLIARHEARWVEVMINELESD